jgi:hypothetical protein
VTAGARLLRTAIVIVFVVIVALALALVGGHSTKAPPRHPAAKAVAVTEPDQASMSPLQARIVSIAQSQIGYSSDPSNTYCNKYSAYWVSGSDDCGNNNLDEEWCADFAAWVWQRAGAEVNYQYINGDLNSSAASFYEWGMQSGTWHPVGDGYTPEPGDVAVYGLDVGALVAQHVAVVTSFTPGDKGPNVVNGDGDHHGYSVVETGQDETKADIADSAGAPLSGYVSPVAS